MTDHTFIVYDHGLFFHIAQRLARDSKVLYYLAEEEPSPHYQSDEIGTGYENVKVIDNLWKHLDKKIPIIFTDVYNGGLPEYLYKEGFPVFGALKSENIEVSRRVLKEVLKKAGLPIVPHVYKTGLTVVQQYLKDKEDKWLKTTYRGDFETYHYQNAFLSEMWFNRKRADMGFGAETIEVLIEDSVPSQCEIGMDTPILNGDIGNYPMIGYEWKDQTYIGRVVDKLPTIMEEVHEKMKPAFKVAGYRGWYSNEIRITDNKVPYYEDATCRFSRPPSEGYCEVYSNFSDAVWDLAHGKMPELKPISPYVVELILTSESGEKDWLPIQFPKEIDRWVKLYTPKKTSEGYYCLPHSKDGFVGAVVAMGNNLKDTMRTCFERAKMIRADDLTYHENSFKHIIQAIEAGKKFGIRMQ